MPEARMSGPTLDPNDLDAALKARSELGQELEPQVIDAFLERIVHRHSSLFVRPEPALGPGDQSGVRAIERDVLACGAGRASGSRQAARSPGSECGCPVARLS